ncbi:hypothetical protein I2I11_09845 [Pontibacter sp. 172403-2]|uniref:hypothetical protein n=1 Tax=Pontibacter rufus TaxID=2791028 RepID=UPI0018AF7A1D|nr:hypothetical protein [Pontibacter sp. 172403-2]MBF9253593.1 hypothetical protein [Pontibacter sp. 172403-2]
MIVSLERSGYHSPIDDFVDSLADRNLTFYASDMLSRKGCESMEDLLQALKRATEVCTSMHLPLRENIKVVFRSRGGEVVQDWRLSPMAYLLMVINADYHNDLVAHMQVEMAKRALHQY